MEKKRVLFISQEIFPFLPKSEISSFTRRISQSTQEEGKEIRVFMPRFGVINERRHQLHEVIRLSGLNLSIDDQVHPLIIKVASVSAARMQVYFIDNDDFFKRKHLLTDEQGNDFKDNDERAMFFVRGTLETVKKLGWQPDLIHCNGWFAGMMALYIKHVYKKDPHFKDTKVVYNLFNEGMNRALDPRFSEKLKLDGFPKAVVEKAKDTRLASITQLIVDHCDGLTVAEPTLSDALQKIYDEAPIHKLPFMEEDKEAKMFSSFFDQVLGDPVMAD
ncbi:MAG: glycogen/starch synthase [Flavobacteriales bacterium]|jgi:starch synthase